MSEKTLSVQRQTNFSVMDTGPMAQWDEYVFKLESHNLKAPGKLFLKDPLGLTGSEISLNKLPPGRGLPFWHKHDQSEEVYIFLGGQGEFYVDDSVLPVTEGTVIRVKPEARRTWRNTSTTEPLYYVVIQTKEDSFEPVTVEDGRPVEAPLPW